MLGIASTCERPDKAMDLLNLIYSDAEVANLLQYGVEDLIMLQLKEQKMLLQLKEQKMQIIMVIIKDFAILVMI